MELTNILKCNQNQLKEMVFEALATPPASPVEGQVYYDSTRKEIGVYDGSDWDYLGIGDIESITGIAPIQISMNGTEATISIDNATPATAGAMSADDKTKLDGIEEGAQKNLELNVVGLTVSDRRSQFQDVPELMSAPHAEIVFDLEKCRVTEPMKFYIEDPIPADQYAFKIVNGANAGNPFNVQQWINSKYQADYSGDKKIHNLTANEETIYKSFYNDSVLAEHIWRVGIYVRIDSDGTINTLLDIFCGPFGSEWFIQEIQGNQYQGDYDSYYTPLYQIELLQDPRTIPHGTELVDGVNCIITDWRSVGKSTNVQGDWNETDANAPSYINNKPVNVTQSEDGFMSAADKTKLDGIANGAEVNVQSDWNQTDTNADDYIQNKPEWESILVKTETELRNALSKLSTKGAGEVLFGNDIALSAPLEYDFTGIVLNLCFYRLKLNYVNYIDLASNRSSNSLVIINGTITGATSAPATDIKFLDINANNYTLVRLKDVWLENIISADATSNPNIESNKLGSTLRLEMDFLSIRTDGANNILEKPLHLKMINAVDALHVVGVQNKYFPDAQNNRSNKFAVTGVVPNLVDEREFLHDVSWILKSIPGSVSINDYLWGDVNTINIQSDWTQGDTNSDDYIKNKPVNVTQAVDGFMSAADKTKLDGIASGAEVNVQADWNATSGDAYIQNKPDVYLKSETYSQAEVDALVDATIKPPEGYDPTATSNYPVTYDGAGVQKGDSFRISAAGTMNGTTVNAEDLLIALVDSPGQTVTNWIVAESNRDQATETVKGVAAVATQTETNDGTNDTDFVTPLKLHEKLKSQTYTQTVAQTFTTPTLSSFVVSHNLNTNLIHVQTWADGQLVHGEVVRNSVNQITVNFSQTLSDYGYAQLDVVVVGCGVSVPAAGEFLYWSDYCETDGDGDNTGNLYRAAVVADGAGGETTQLPGTLYEENSSMCPIPQFTLTVTDPANGNITSIPSPGSLNKGTTVTAEATANPNYQVDSILWNGSPMNPGGEVLTENTTITATLSSITATGVKLVQLDTDTYVARMTPSNTTATEQVIVTTTSYMYEAANPSNTGFWADGAYSFTIEINELQDNMAATVLLTGIPAGWVGVIEIDTVNPGTYTIDPTKLEFNSPN